MNTVLVVGTKAAMSLLLRRFKNETIYQVLIVRTIARAMTSARSMPLAIIVDEGLDVSSLHTFLGENGLNMPVHVINPADQAQIDHIVTHLKGGWPVATMLAGRKLLSVEDLDSDQTREVLDLAHEYHAQFVAPRLSRPKRLDILAGLDMIGLFYEPSSRTALSFRRAAMNLGMDAAIVFEAATQTSKAKGESDPDTGMIVSAYTDLLVVRSPIVGAPKEIAEASSIPFINAGNGDDEHPTQAWLDLLTIELELGIRNLNGLKIAFIGDPRFARSIHSLAKLLALRDDSVEMTFVAPEKLWLPEKLCQWLSARCHFKGCSTDLRAGLEDVHVAYITRVQAERFRDSQPDLFEELKAERPKYRINRALIERVNPEVLLMHPLPRVDELDPDVDTLKKAAYFRQAAAGVPLRMALIQRLLQYT